MNLQKLKNEDQFILHACSLKEDEINKAPGFITSSFDWKYFWEESTRNSVSGILYKRCKEFPKIGNLVPPHIYQNLQQYYFKTLAPNTRIFKALEETLKFLYDEGFKNIIILKGGYLLPEVYKDIGIRPMSDIDVLLPNLATVDEIFTILTSKKKFTSKIYRSKWEKDSRKKITGKAPEILKDELVIELHAPIAFKSLPQDWNSIIKNTKNFTIGSTHALKLSNPHHAKLIDEHFYQHMNRRAFDLRMIIDRLYFHSYINKHDGSIYPFLENLSNNVEANRNVFLPVILKKIAVLIKNKYLLRYCFSFFFPSYKYLQANFRAKNSTYFNLHILYLLDFFKRFKN